MTYPYNNQPFNRVEEGRVVLKRLLDRILDQAGENEQFRLGLVVFGHRVGYVGPKGKEVLQPPNTGFFPSTDVQAFGLTKLNRASAATLDGFLGTLKARGETPLYLSLLTALDLFSPDRDASRHIIAITDGVDYVSENRQAPAYDATATKVLAALEKKPTRIDVVEFAVDEKSFSPQQRVEFEVGRPEVQQITGSRFSNGKWQPAANTVDLEDALLDSLRLDRYRATPVGANDVANVEFADLNKATTLAPPLAPTKYEIQMQSPKVQPEMVEVEGGEALELAYRRAPENLLVYPVFEPELAAETRPGFRIASHTPLWQLGDPVFRFSIQSGDERVFSRRPEVIWAMIEPLYEERPRKYYFMDRDFQPHTSVPMLNLRPRMVGRQVCPRRAVLRAEGRRSRRRLDFNSRSRRRRIRQQRRHAQGDDDRNSGQGISSGRR